MAPIFQKWTHDNVAMFAAEGSIDKKDTQKLLEKIASGDFSKVTEIYVDLSGVRFFSPYAASLLFGRYQEMKEKGKKLMFINPNDVSSFYLKLFGADYIFPIVDGC